mmetsp:Transcript_33428/g.92368  ORF Transcript_33428/g.92368 Transcript_33428/m.92368 type:complete len:234 (-) Transcript_33428:1404-2105(-)
MLPSSIPRPRVPRAGLVLARPPRTRAWRWPRPLPRRLRRHRLGVEARTIVEMRGLRRPGWSRMWRGRGERRPAHAHVERVPGRRSRRGGRRRPQRMCGRCPWRSVVLPNISHLRGSRRQQAAKSIARRSVRPTAMVHRRPLWHIPRWRWASHDAIPRVLPARNWKRVWQPFVASFTVPLIALLKRWANITASSANLNHTALQRRSDRIHALEVNKSKFAIILNVNVRNGTKHL